MATSPIDAQVLSMPIDNIVQNDTNFQVSPMKHASSLSSSMITNEKSNMVGREQIYHNS